MICHDHGLMISVCEHYHIHHVRELVSGVGDSVCHSRKLVLGESEVDTHNVLELVREARATLN
jgi:hypothetical protein